MTFELPEEGWTLDQLSAAGRQALAEVSKEVEWLKAVLDAMSTTLGGGYNESRES